MDLVEWKPKQNTAKENADENRKIKAFRNDKNERARQQLNGANAIENNDESAIRVCVFFSFSLSLPVRFLCFSLSIFFLFFFVHSEFVRNVYVPSVLLDLGALSPFTLIFQIARKITFFSAYSVARALFLSVVCTLSLSVARSSAHSFSLC